MKYGFLCLLLCHLFLIADAQKKGSTKPIKPKNNVQNSSVRKSEAPMAPVTRSASVVLGTCQCQLSKSEANIVSTEDTDSCGTDRLYYQNQFMKINDLYRLPRQSQNSVDFPPVCIGYILKDFIDAIAKPSSAYAYCHKAEGAPIRSRKKHCVTTEYVYSIYNSFVDVMDCLDIHDKDLIPKLFNESGFHVNTLGRGMDAGVGQLTYSAISSVQEYGYFDGRDITWLDMFKEEISKSDKESCKRLAAQPEIFKKVSDKPTNRCSLIGVPENPLKNILYTGIFYHYILKAQTGSRFRKGFTYIESSGNSVKIDDKNREQDFEGLFKEYNVKQKLKELGLENPNMQSLKQIMVTLGYNAGLETAVVFLNRYLTSRLKIKAKLTEDDFNFQKYFPSHLKKKQSDPALEKQRLQKLQYAKTAPYRLPFPQYLRMVQKVGTPGYLSEVMVRKFQLDKELGDGLCTNATYLKF